MEITIRRLETLDEYAQAEQLQIDAWQAGPLDAVPRNLLIRFQRESGLVLGAFTPEARLVGFVVGFLGRDDHGLKHCSHMAAVHPDFRDRNIAYQLKLAQREFALGDGLDLITWTYDPLEARNANLNIAKLGAICRSYIENIYGIPGHGMNAGIPTDRFYVRWEITSARVRQAIESGQRVVAPQAEQVLSSVEVRNGVPYLVDIRLAAGEPVLGVQIPADFQKLKWIDNQAAIAWRMGTRSIFQAAFAAGYTVVNITRDPLYPQALGRYTLVQST